MAEQSTFIKLDRNMMRWRWYQDLPTKSLFIHLLFKANIKPVKWRGITIERGQLVTSYAKLADEVGLSIQQIRTALANLLSTQEITKESTQRYTLITLNNYDTYQNKPTQRKSSDQHTINKQPTNDQQQLKKDITYVISKERKKKGKECATAQHPSARDWETKIPMHLRGEFDSWEEYDEWRQNH